MKNARKAKRQKRANCIMIESYENTWDSCLKRRGQLCEKMYIRKTQRYGTP